MQALVGALAATIKLSYRGFVCTERNPSIWRYRSQLLQQLDFVSRLSQDIKIKNHQPPHQIWYLSRLVQFLSRF
jgi:hypothetical protein